MAKVPIATNGSLPRDLEEGTPLIRPSRNSLIRSTFRGLYWEGIRVDVTEKAKQGPFRTVKTQKTILKNVSGSVEKGRFLAVMGSSGAGKSTLLNVLASRLAPTAGQVYYNSTPLAAVPNLNQRLAYVMQEDVLLNTLTVREALTFSALLRLRAPKEAKLRRVEEVLNELGLRRCAETRIGKPSAGGISGGERKRLAIAIELIHDPPILMLDEPTSGLDSFTAESVIATLRRLAASGRTVVATIHQPSSEVFAMFDSLLLLAHGSVVYQGDAKEVVSYFGGLGYTLPELTNPADYFMRVLRMDSTGPGDEASLKVDDRLIAAKFINAYEEYSTRKGGKGGAAGGAEKEGGLEVAGYPNGFFAQFLVLIRRQALATTREPMTGWVRVFQTAFMAIVYSAIYPRLGLDQSGILSRLGAVFFLVTNQAMGPLFGILNTFPQERALVQREKENGMYRLSAYYMGKVMIELPLQGLFPVVFVAVVYYIINFRNAADAFLTLCLITTLMAWVASGLGLAISAICPNLNVALAIGPLFILPFMLFGGFLTSDGSIPAYFKWLNAISFFRMAFQAGIINEFRGYDQAFCEGGQRCAYPNKDAVFEAYGMKEDQLWTLVIGLAVYAVALRVLAYLFLIYSTRSRIVSNPSE